MAKPFDDQQDLGSRDTYSFVESVSVPGQVARAVVNPDGTDIGSGGGGGANVNIHDSAGANITNGQQTMANSVPVVVASNQTPIPVSMSSDIEIGAVELKDGTTNDRASVDASGRQLTRITDTNGATIANGQQVMASSVPVVIASNQSAIPVSISGSATALTPSSGQVNVGAGPTQTALGVGQVDMVHVIANITNLNNIAIGPTGVTTANGLILEPGRGMTIESVSLSTVFINGTAGEGVSWFALT